MSKGVKSMGGVERGWRVAMRDAGGVCQGGGGCGGWEGAVMERVRDVEVGRAPNAAAVAPLGGEER